MKNIEKPPDYPFGYTCVADMEKDNIRLDFIIDVGIQEMMREKNFKVTIGKQ